MNERELATRIRQDLQRAAAGRGRVLYLEGKTDVPILLALLGAQHPLEVSDAVLHDGVLIRGLRGDRDGSGSSAVTQHLEVARRHVYPGVFGVLDGDGEELHALAAEFDAPHAGPRFRWKSYCIENLLARGGWPEPWGPAAGPQEALRAFAPYVALNRVGSELRGRLRQLRLHRFIRPTYDELHTADEVLGMLRAGKELLAGVDVVALFAAELDAFHAALARDLDEAHALLNGKWLVDVFAPRRTGRTQTQCRDEWTEHLRRAGGDPEIKAWWRRVVAPA